MSEKIYGKNIKLEYINLSKLEIDPTYQREASAKLANQRAKTYHDKSVRPLSVSKRVVDKKTHYFVYDGLQRLTMYRNLATGTDPKIPCIVRNDMTREEEAQATVDINHNITRFSPSILWTTRYEAKDEFIVQITDLFRSKGFAIGSFDKEGKRARGTCSFNSWRFANGLARIEKQLLGPLYQANDLKEADKIVTMSLDIISKAFPNDNYRTNYILFSAIVRFVAENYKKTGFTVKKVSDALAPFCARFIIDNINAETFFRSVGGKIKTKAREQVGVDVIASRYNSYYNYKKTSKSYATIFAKPQKVLAGE